MGDARRACPDMLSVTLACPRDMQQHSCFIPSIHFFDFIMSPLCSLIFVSSNSSSSSYFFVAVFLLPHHQRTIVLLHNHHLSHHLAQLFAISSVVIVFCILFFFVFPSSFFVTVIAEWVQWIATSRVQSRSFF